MGVDTRKLMAVLLKGEDQYSIHRKEGAEEIIVGEDLRAQNINRMTVKEAVRRGLVEWVPCSHFPTMQVLQLTDAGRAESARKDRNGFLRTRGREPHRVYA